MEFAKERIEAQDGSIITLTFYAHASVGMEWRGIQIYVDPAGAYNQIDFSIEPKADLILVTHHHKDHLDKKSISQLLKENGIVIASTECRIGIVAIPGKTIHVLGIPIDIVPAYNITPEHLQYHPKERMDCGYVLNLGGTRIYIAGDTEDNEDVLALRYIDIAFLSLNQPYTMTVKQVTNVIETIKPKTAYLYHTKPTNNQNDFNDFLRVIPFVNKYN